MREFFNKAPRPEFGPGRTIACADSSGAVGKSVVSEKTKAPERAEKVLLTTGEAADILRLSPRTLERFRVEGAGPPYIKLGSGKRARVVYRKSDLEDWIDSSVFVSTSEYVD